MSNSEIDRPQFNILLIEDSPSDVYLVKEAFKDNPSVRSLNAVGDGDAAIAYLRRKGSYANVPRPDLILLDLNLPGTSGREVLLAVKTDDSLKCIPVIVLTSSQSDEDRSACYNLHANAFMTKTMDIDELEAMVAGISNYWFSMVKLPPNLEN